MTPDGWRWHAWVNNAVRDEDGKVIAVVASGRDITEKKEAETARRKSEERYRAVVDACPDAILQTDLEGKVLYASPHAAELHGYASGDDLVGTDSAVPGEAAIGCFFATWARAFVKLVSEHMFAYKLGLAIMPPAVSGMLGSLDGERNRRGSPSSYRVRQAAQGFVRGFFVSLGPRRLWEAPRPPGPEGHHSSGRRAFLGLRHVLAQGRLVAGLRPTP